MVPRGLDCSSFIARGKRSSTWLPMNFITQTRRHFLRTNDNESFYGFKGMSYGSDNWFDMDLGG